MHKISLFIVFELLKESDLSIKAISTMVGYCNVPGFRNKFKEYYGVNASEYRKQYNENLDEIGNIEIDKME